MEIEIPFGAFDSELMRQEINIPEGFEATIEGNKIILTKTESEDEQHRKWILEYLYDGLRKSDEQFKDQFKCAIAWLEKQKATNEEIVFRPLAGTDIRIAAKQSLEKIEIGKKVVLALNGAYIPVNGKTVGEIENEYDVWLEKQGEQKPVDKAEPKFEVGDWINGYYTNYKVTAINSEGYVVEDTDGNKLNILFENEKFHHLFTIADAKEGDVLHSLGFHSDCIFIFNRLDNWKFDELDGERAVATGYCCLTLSADNMEFGIQGPDCIKVDTVKPATKIQRDLLFQKMKEAEYEFDFDKKELKKIEDESENFK